MAVLSPHLQNRRDHQFFYQLLTPRVHMAIKNWCGLYILTRALTLHSLVQEPNVVCAELQGLNQKIKQEM